MLANVLAQFGVLRIDLTQDKHHTLSNTTKDLMQRLDGELLVQVYLSGDFNSGFMRLGNATRQLLAELSIYGNLRYDFSDPVKLSDEEHNELDNQLLRHGLHPTVIYETTANGIRQETLVYPFACVNYAGRRQWINLLENRRDLSGAENLNHSTEALEYKFALCLNNLTKPDRDKIVFLEGQGELPEQNTMDVQSALAEYFDVYRGAIISDVDCLDMFRAVIIADPQTRFSEQEKFVIDQYLMQGGSVLWFVNGVRFSEQVLQDEGYTPALALDVNLTDMLFRYGVRINNHLLQDMQCLSVPVDVSRQSDQPQWQPMPWHYAPLLLTADNSPITNNLSPVVATFCSDLSLVGDDDGIDKNILLASSSAAKLLPVPSEVDLGELGQDPHTFTLSYLPVAISLEGNFSSLFAHRMSPEGINMTRAKLTESKRTRQIVVAAGSVVSNDLQQGQPLPAGYDRYSRTQFANRDFVVNSVLWLTDYNEVLNLRRKTMPLRLLNKNSLQKGISIPLVAGLGLPLLLLLCTGVIVVLVRKRKYAK